MTPPNVRTATQPLPYHIFSILAAEIKLGFLDPNQRGSLTRFSQPAHDFFMDKAKFSAVCYFFTFSKKFVFEVFMRIKLL